ncbi:ABC transporter ATP-binding protein [Bordetella flabilis]|uniref:ABC transporter ATP-binding protein n=1 Tax=Bordetella flabilis TaxID=463014 RepID=UPI000B1D6D6D|nr:ABC transporter ATP-binding protein [Bordetella flabilis]
MSADVSATVSAPDGTGQEPIIVFDGVDVDLGGQRIYDKLGFRVARGEFVCILGPSGCGKSTSLRVMGGLLPVAAGEVSVAGLPPSQAWSEIAFVFQSPRLVSWRNALDNILLASELRFGKGGKEEQARRRERALALLDMVGLAQDAGKYPSALSGGERQRVAIARALAVDPQIIFMDEPFSALDPNTRQRMRAEIEEIWRRTGKTVVFVTHDIDEALQLADRIILFSGKPTTVLETMTIDTPRPRRLDDDALASRRHRLARLFRDMESADVSTDPNGG